MNILLAEDDLFNQMFAIQVLNNEGYSVHIAENGKQAVDIGKTTTIRSYFNGRSNAGNGWF